MTILVLMLSALITLGSGLANHVDQGIKPQIDYETEQDCGQENTNPCQIFIR